MLRGELPYPPIARTLDFRLVEVSEGVAIFQGTPGVEHLNPMGTVHGGWYPDSCRGRDHEEINHHTGMNT